MFSLEEWFCCVDDFCQRFEPVWQRQLLSSGLQQRDRDRRLCLSEIMTILIGFHDSTLSHLQALLLGSCLCVLAEGVSQAGELQPLCPLDALSVAAVVRLPEAVLWQLQWH
jgi:hypothetical protein